MRVQHRQEVFLVLSQGPAWTDQLSQSRSCSDLRSHASRALSAIAGKCRKRTISASMGSAPG
jgi:hypothetical protein